MKDLAFHFDWLSVAALAAMFFETFLRGFQNKNVHAGYTKLAIVFGFLMSLMDVLVIGFVVHSGWAVAVFAAIGSGIGWGAAMKAHAYLMKDQMKALKKAKKEKHKKWIEKALEKKLDEEAYEHIIQNATLSIIDELIVSEEEITPERLMKLRNKIQDNMNISAN